MTLPCGSVIDTIVLLNVLLMCAAPIALHLEVAFDVVAQVGHLIVGQVLGAHVPVDAGGFQNLLGAGTADAVDVGQRDLHALIAREVNAHKSGHGCAIPSVAEVWSQSVPSSDEASAEESSIYGVRPPCRTLQAANPLSGTGISSLSCASSGNAIICPSRKRPPALRAGGAPTSPD